MSTLLALICLTRCQHAVLSSIIETLLLIGSSYWGWVHKQLTTSHTAFKPKFNKPQVADRCCYDWQNQVHAVCLFGPNQSGKMSACGAQFYHWDVAVVTSYWSHGIETTCTSSPRLCMPIQQVPFFIGRKQHSARQKKWQNASAVIFALAGLWWMSRTRCRETAKKTAFHWACTQ